MENKIGFSHVDAKQLIGCLIYHTDQTQVDDYHLVLDATRLSDGKIDFVLMRLKTFTKWSGTWSGYENWSNIIFSGSKETFKLEGYSRFSEIDDLSLPEV